jgi:hypothetical protein
MVRRTTNEDREWPVFPIGPILVEYGGEEARDDHTWYAYKCPFHGDRSASASVNTILNVFVCHTCDMKGNATQLIMKKENCSYGDALRRAEEVAGKGAGNVRVSSDGSRRVSGRSGNRSGSRALRRTWRSS